MKKPRVRAVTQLKNSRARMPHLINSKAQTQLLTPKLGHTDPGGSGWYVWSLLKKIHTPSCFDSKIELVKKTLL